MNYLGDLVSIVIPIYNVGEYLSKCIDSIVNQTYKKLEIILVDDGSTDCSGKVCDQYSQKDNRIKVIHKKNNGVAKAREDGVKAATGKYISFVDGDDYVETDYCEKLLAVMLKYDVDWVACERRDVDDKGNDITEYERRKNDEYIRDRSVLFKDCADENPYCFTMWAKLYKTELFENYNFVNLKIAEDACTTIDIFLKTSSAYLMKYIGYNYFIRENSVMHSSSFRTGEFDRIKGFNYIESIFDKFYPEYKSKITNKRDFMILGAYNDLVKIGTKKEKKIYMPIIKNIIKERYKYHKEQILIKGIKKSFFLISYCEFIFKIWMISKRK